MIDNVDALGWELQKEDLDLINVTFPKQLN
ncbi:hypothetical protein QFZ77_004380 [Paenibacillus sp. V4I3]|nr:hypothetical protein [Paenibacillus sp. V4I3]MDQ0888209.1 hypothetical protein [Paenibacillus sp. V4I9]